jgi:ADP-ribosyl-[dinitrogen reductase] hydrolase
MSTQDKIKGGLYGLLIGDAAGVPYEFKSPHYIPKEAPLPNLDVPEGYSRTYASIPVGTWSDDGAQALCLVASIVQKDGLKRADFGEKLLAWRSSGYMTPDDEIFDIGIQTQFALDSLMWKQPLAATVNSNGNGSLMRALPIGLYYSDPKDIVEQSYKQSALTHPHGWSMAACALYCLFARGLLNGLDKYVAWDWAVEQAKVQLPAFDKQQGTNSLDRVLQGQHEEPIGSGFVVNSLWSALTAFFRNPSYEEVIRDALQFGNDTDTTACIAGGLAGVHYGLEGIPQSFIDALRGRDLAGPLIKSFATKSQIRYGKIS